MKPSTLHEEQARVDAQLAELAAIDYRAMLPVNVLARGTRQQRRAVQTLLGAKTDDPETLVQQLRREGSRALATWLLRRGQNLGYDQVARAAAKRIGVWQTGRSAAENELALLHQVATDAYLQLPSNSRAELARRIDTAASETGHTLRAADLLSADGLPALHAVAAEGLAFAPYLVANLGLRAALKGTAVAFPFAPHCRTFDALAQAFETGEVAAALDSKLLARQSVHKTVPGVCLVGAMRAELEYRRQQEIVRLKTKRRELGARLDQLKRSTKPRRSEPKGAVDLAPASRQWVKWAIGATLTLASVLLAAML